MSHHHSLIRTRRLPEVPSRAVFIDSLLAKPFRGSTALIVVTEETVKTTGGSNIQARGSKTPSGKRPATDCQLLQDILELTARNELAEAQRRLNDRANARLDDFLKTVDRKT